MTPLEQAWFERVRSFSTNPSALQLAARLLATRTRERDAYQAGPWVEDHHGRHNKEFAA